MGKIFRVVRGSHFEQGKKFKQGDILESLTDLNRMNSPGAIKFQEMPAGTPLKGGEVLSGFNTSGSQSTQEETVSPDKQDLESMTVSELKQLAEDYELEFSASAKKPELVELLSEALA